MTPTADSALDLALLACRGLAAKTGLPAAAIAEYRMEQAAIQHDGDQLRAFTQAHSVLTTSEGTQP